MNIINDEFSKSLIGKTKEDVIKLCEENNYEFRIVRQDSIDYVITCDLRFDRINLTIDNGLITDSHLG